MLRLFDQRVTVNTGGQCDFNGHHRLEEVDRQRPYQLHVVLAVAIVCVEDAVALF